MGETRSVEIPLNRRLPCHRRMYERSTVSSSNLYFVTTQGHRLMEVRSFQTSVAAITEARSLVENHRVAWWVASVGVEVEGFTEHLADNSTRTIRFPFTRTIWLYHRFPPESTVGLVYMLSVDGWSSHIKETNYSRVVELAMYYRLAHPEREIKILANPLGDYHKSLDPNRWVDMFTTWEITRDNISRFQHQRGAYPTTRE